MPKDLPWQKYVLKHYKKGLFLKQFSQLKRLDTSGQYNRNKIWEWATGTGAWEGSGGFDLDGIPQKIHPKKREFIMLKREYEEGQGKAKEKKKANK